MSHDEADTARKINSVKNWYHRIEVQPGITTPGVNDSQAVLRLLNLPEDFSGKRVLDLGTRDGFFAFEAARRGAEVVAVDYVPSDKTGFKVAAELLNVDVTYANDYDGKDEHLAQGVKAQRRAGGITYVQENIYHLSAKQYGTFDVIFCLGLLYHLPDPLLALNIIRELCSEDLYLETHVIDKAFLKSDGTFIELASLSADLEHSPIMQFYPGSSLNNDPSNYWAPNLKCMELMLMESSFAVHEMILNGQRGIFKCQTVDDTNLKYFMDIATGAVVLS